MSEFLNFLDGFVKIARRPGRLETPPLGVESGKFGVSVLFGFLVGDLPEMRQEPTARMASRL